MLPDLSAVSLVLKKLIRARMTFNKMNLFGVMMSPSILKALSEDVLVAGKGQLAFQNLAKSGNN
jgi:hypothetical protein